MTGFDDDRRQALSVWLASEPEEREEFGGVSREVLSLGLALSPLPYVPYRLLRQIRRIVLPERQAIVEAEFTQSAFVASRAADGFQLAGPARIRSLELLRTRAGSGDLSRDQVADLNDLLYASVAEILSPLLVVEFELLREYLELPPDELPDVVEGKLRHVVTTALSEGREGIIEWAAAAQRRVPPECMIGQSAWMLAQMAAARRLSVDFLPLPEQMSWEGLAQLRSHGLPTTVLGLHRSSGFIEFGPPSPKRNVGVTLLDTHPRLVRLHGPDGQSLPVRIERGQITRVAWPHPRCVLESMTGQTFTLGDLVHGRGPEALDADRAMQAVLEAKRHGRFVPATVHKEVDAGYVVHLDGLGATALTTSPYAVLHRGDKLKVKIEHVSLDRRWVAARAQRVDREVQRPGEGVAYVPEPNMPAGVRTDDRFAARLISYGKKRGDRRSAHVLVEPTSALSRLTYSHRPGFVRFPRAVHDVDGKWLPAIGSDLVVHVAGLISGRWELRLGLGVAGQAHTTDYSFMGSVVSATVTQVSFHGAELRTADLIGLWLPRREMTPRPATNLSPRLANGDTIDVRVVGVDQSRSAYTASQRAATLPDFQLLRRGTVLQGVVFKVGRDGRTWLMIDPIEGVADAPFLARFLDSVKGQRMVGTRATVVVSRVIRSSWTLLVDVHEPSVES